MTQVVEDGPMVTVRKSQNWREKVYHTDADCPRLKSPDRYRKVPLKSLNGSYRECKWCRDETSDPEWNSRTCPKCGADTKCLGAHLRHCDGGGSDE